MSRSYRKHPKYIGVNNRHAKKTDYARHLRRTSQIREDGTYEIPNGSAYRRYDNSVELDDWSWLAESSWREFRDRRIEEDSYFGCDAVKSDKEYKRQWYRWARGK